jgi:glycosyltransferase involved in cell wall biosynthesis
VTFDVIFATFAYPHGYAARVLAEETGVPYVVKVRGSDLHSLPPSGARRELSGAALQGAAAVVAVSGNLAKIAVELGAEPARVHVVLNGVDAGRFPTMPRAEARARLGLPVDGPVFLCVGHLLPVKGVDVLVAAFEAITGMGTLPDGARLLFAGAGPMRRRIERRRDRIGLREAIRLLGHVSREQVALYMNAADVLVLPSRNEGCPNVVLEALSCGTPVVASRVGAVPDLIDDTCGIVVEPERPEALGAAMIRALKKRWDRAAMRRRVEVMSWEANAAKLHAILLGAVEGSAAGRVEGTR